MVVYHNRFDSEYNGDIGLDCSNYDVAPEIVEQSEQSEQSRRR